MYPLDASTKLNTYAKRRCNAMKLMKTFWIVGI